MKNNLLKVILAFVLILSVFTPLSVSTTEAASKTYTAYVNVKGSLNVREKPSVKSKKLGTLKNGAKVTLIVKSKDEWSTIRYKNKNAYVKTEFLLFSTVFWNGKYGFDVGTEEKGYAEGRSLTITKQSGNKFNVEISDGLFNGFSWFTGGIKATATYKGNSAKINHTDGNGSCKLTLTRTKTGVKVSEKFKGIVGQCDAFHGANIDFNVSYPLKK